MRKVVYTVATKGFCLAEQNCSFSDPSIDRICFTDDESLTSDWWTVVALEKGFLDSHRESRRPKLLPHKYLEGYDCSLYIDSSLVFKTDPADIFDVYASQTDFSFFCFPHPRNCIYKEAEAVIAYAYEDEQTVRGQMDAYRLQGYPENNGLITGGMLLRHHHHPVLKELSEEWFEHVLAYSKRDQLSFDFLAFKKQFSYGTFPGVISDNPLVDWQAGKWGRVAADFDSRSYLVSALSASRDGVGSLNKNLFKRRNNYLNALANKYKSDKGDIYYNSHAYAEIYDKYLQGLRNRPVTLLELGLLRHDVQSISPSILNQAPSLSMWHDYFPAGEIHGFDIADFSGYCCPPGVQVHRGDMGVTDDLMAMLKKVNLPLDIIIDDASHASHHQQIAFGTLFSYLAPGGFYFIEDLNYQPVLLERQGDFKTLDILRKIASSKPSFSNYINSENLKAIVADIEYVRLYDSCDRASGADFRDSFAVIKKKKRAKAKTI
ncbi:MULTISPECIES: glycosyltransferase domain-containing protein [Alcaligenes]|uniref:glycosyltransferase domain-containing protein n=1 Tax=Alcaligenes TaxID=507 RepID=UPI000302F09B|nr:MULTISPECIES: glycosyltransferase domain-containing protein [Alcaligenes]ERI35027.1 hypothetical protein N879_05765 [Alcaligenes sp. EGD-AK7]UTM01996.1 DUF616 domain-containing protein [Alcaligenes sp. NLF5-7]HRO20871.1 DUF616 domain-containing protein [Alcaligenes phenolicus]HRP13702.1 DUF616 domain-containing protein [Alcaligenes phenolicus]